MPGGDRTGPLGAGPMTGRGAGYCAGYPVPGYANPIGGRGWFGRGRGRGWYGRGRGWRRWHGPGWAPNAYADPYVRANAYPIYPYAPELAPDEEIDMLKEQSKMLQNELKDIQERIGILEKAEAQEKK